MPAMAVSSTTRAIVYAGNASTVTPYPVPFRLDDAAWLYVTHIAEDGTRTALVAGDDYTLSGDGQAGTAEIVTDPAIPATDSLALVRTATPLQSLDLEANEPLPAEDLEAALDRLALAVQDAAGRSLRLPAAEAPGDLPAAGDRAGKFLGFDAAGDPALYTAAEILALAE